ncbi:MAG: type IIA DNA topoisomerase subunit B, partial [Alistipes sp.]|nr:type IIA DNA topoisomerase subunit B [Alistipes sp.]
MAELDIKNNSYGDDAIITLTPREHIRLRPGMYIGKLGDGTQVDDGIYVLIKEVVDNSIDEFIMGAGKQVEITIEDNVVSVRDYG